MNPLKCPEDSLTVSPMQSKHAYMAKQNESYWWHIVLYVNWKAFWISVSNLCCRQAQNMNKNLSSLMRLMRI